MAADALGPNPRKRVSGALRGRPLRSRAGKERTVHHARNAISDRIALAEPASRPGVPCWRVGADRDLSTDARQMGEGRQGREAGGAPGGTWRAGRWEAWRIRRWDAWRVTRRTWPGSCRRRGEDARADGKGSAPDSRGADAPSNRVLPAGISPVLFLPSCGWLTETHIARLV